VPVAPLVDRVSGDDDHVADPRADLVVAARAAVRLDRLVRLDPPDLDRVGVGVLVGKPMRRHRAQPNTAQAMIPRMTANAASTSSRSLLRFTRFRYGL
jgi:hypothetical protein